MSSVDWVQEERGNWNDPSDWVGDKVPTATDNALISSNQEPFPSAANVTSLITVRSISIHNSFLDFYDGGTGTSYVSNNILNESYLSVSDNLTVGGAIENTEYTSHCEVDAGGVLNVRSFDNSDNASLDLEDDGESGQATLSIRGGASFGTAGTVTGSIDMADGALISFGGTRQITTILGGLSLEGPNAFVADRALGVTSNSALTGLAKIDGYLELEYGATVDVRHGLTIETPNAFVSVDTAFDSSKPANVGGGLSVAAALVNDATMRFGNFDYATQDLLHVDGRTYNDGSMTFINTTEDFTNGIYGSGTFSLGDHAAIEFDSTVAGGERVYLSKNDSLTLADPSHFSGTVHKFGHDASYLFEAFDSNTTFDFAANSSGTGGVLNVSDGAMGSAHIKMAGSYDTADFHLATVQGGVKISSTS